VNVVQAAVLGVVEGLTEFIPVSSTAHLKIVPKLLGWGDPGAAFSAVIQVGAIVAVLIYFRGDLWGFTRAWFAGLRDAGARHSQDYRMAWYVIFATVPIGIAGLVFQSAIEGSLRSLWVIATTLVVVGLALMWAEIVAAGRRRRKDEAATRWSDIVVIGLVQCLSLIPGVSRSGATISAGLFRGLDRITATRFSFLLSIPAITAAGVFELAKQSARGAITDWTPLLVGTAIAFVVAYASIAWFLRYVATHSFRPFVWYRLAAGGLLFGLLGTGVLTP